MGGEKLEYWNYNVPQNERTAECPEALKNLSVKDKTLIALCDNEYHIQTWNEVKDIAAAKRVDLFHRAPSDLRRYRQFVHQLNHRPGGVPQFILDERLKWSSTTARGAAFEFEDDYKILYNDWPYGVDPRIVHLVVWTKFILPEDITTGELTSQMREVIHEWVDTTFGDQVEKQNVLWFRNWKSLKSVDSVEHFHVMLFNPDPKFVADITHGDSPYCSNWTPE